jgi:hypothetical protein
VQLSNADTCHHMQGVFGGGDTPLSGSLEAILDELGK